MLPINWCLTDENPDQVAMYVKHPKKFHRAQRQGEKCRRKRARKTKHHIPPPTHYKEHTYDSIIPQERDKVVIRHSNASTGMVEKVVSIDDIVMPKTAIDFRRRELTKLTELKDQALVERDTTWALFVKEEKKWLEEKRKYEKRIDELSGRSVGLEEALEANISSWQSKYDNKIEELEETICSLTQRNCELEAQCQEIAFARADYNSFRSKYEEELDKNSRLRDKIHKLTGGTVKLDSPFWKINQTINNLDHFRTQVHSDAIEIFEDSECFQEINQSRQHQILFDAFVFSYRYCLEQFSKLSKTVQLDNPRVRGPMLETIQENFDLYLNLNDFDNKYLIWISERTDIDEIEREYLKLDGFRLEYMVASTRLCWVVVLTTSPELDFMPLSSHVEPQLVPYNKRDFLLYSGCSVEDKTNAFVSRYLLPGLVRKDTRRWVSEVALPWVIAKDRQDVKQIEAITLADEVLKCVIGYPV